jgi:hypothetical protein
MKLRIIVLVLVIQLIGIEFSGLANASFLAVSPHFAIVDNGNNGGGSGANVNVGSNCDAIGVCQGSWWKYGSFIGG